MVSFILNYGHSNATNEESSIKHSLEGFLIKGIAYVASLLIKVFFYGDALTSFFILHRRQYIFVGILATVQCKLS